MEKLQDTVVAHLLATKLDNENPASARPLLTSVGSVRVPQIMTHQERVSVGEA